MRHVPVIDAATAAGHVNAGDRVMAGGFGMTGTPVHLLHALAEAGTRDLTLISNNVGEPGLGGGRLLRNDQLSHAVGSFFTSNPEAVKAATAGQLSVTLLPQGSLAEAIRAGGAGIGGFFTPTAAGTALAGGEVRDIGGVPHVYVEALRANVAFLRAWRADRLGNLTYRRTERNFNPLMATAADLVIAEVEDVVDVGQIGPDEVHTPGIYVDYLVQAHTDASDLGSSSSISERKARTSTLRQNIAKRAFQELRPGDVVNLGVGIPTLVADFIGEDDQIVLHTENGMVGVGPSPEEGNALDYPVNAAKEPVTEMPGAAYFDSADSFAMIRGGHVDVAIMGGLQVDAHGNLANWAIPGRPLLGVGGAMDLATNARRLIITMTHTNRDGQPKLVPEVTLPVTTHGRVGRVITELAVFAFGGPKPILVEVRPGATLDEVKAKTGFDFDVQAPYR